MKIQNLYAKIIIEELIRLGVDYFCLAPGSRSTPLVYEVAKQSKAKDIIHYDERGLAFHALGYAKATKKPAVIIITSGSALANLFPAVIEAFYSQIPLIILSADRPFELIDCGSNQAIDQVKFFHNYTHFHSDMPLTDEKVPLNSILSSIDYGYSKSSLGPVHFNLKFREPFLQEAEVHHEKEYLNWLKSQKPLQNYTTYQARPESIQHLDLSPKGVIILGKETPVEELPKVLELSEKLNYPIFADVLAPRSKTLSKNVVTHFDAIIKSGKNHPIESVIQFGHTFLSKLLLQELKKNPPKSYVIVQEKLKRSDPNHLKAHVLNCSPTQFCKNLQLSSYVQDQSWFQSWLHQDQRISSFLNRYFEKNQKLTEPSSARVLFDQSNEGDAFYIASSMPIRDASFFGNIKDKSLLFCNRGASGTDGNLATAFGISQGLDKPIKVLIGDVAFLYDLNSLAQLKEIKHSPTIVVINNSGCGVFKFLPIAQKQDVFRRYFLAEHSFYFEGAALQFDLDYFCPNSLQEYENALSINSNKPKLIEVKTVADENYTLHQKIDHEIRHSLA